MKNKKVLSSLVFVVLGLGLTLAYAINRPSESNQETITRPALTQDLVSGSGEKVVEITEASYQMAENVLKGGSCRVKNLSGQNITGIGLIWTVTFANGETSQMQKLVDYSLHRDIVDAYGKGPFAPYGERVIPYIEREPNLEGRSISSVKVEVTFVVFENSNGIGIENSKMYQRLLLRREGAEIYKKWLDGIYDGDPKNINKVVEKLSTHELPADEKLKNDAVEIGAAAYREWMVGVYKKKGTDSLKQLLKRR